MAYVFVSYIHEDEERLRPLFSALRRAGLNLWIDRKDLAGGSFWKADIKLAIEQGAYFLCCYSQARHSKSTSVAHSELLIAIDKLRVTNFGKRWFILVRVDECLVPDIPVFGNETIRSYHWIDLFLDQAAGLRRVLEALSVEQNVIEEVVGARRLGNRNELSSVNESYSQWFFTTHQEIHEHATMIVKNCWETCNLFYKKPSNWEEIREVEPNTIADTRRVLDTYLQSVKMTLTFFAPYMNGRQFKESSQALQSTIEIDRAWRYVTQDGKYFSRDYDEEALHGIVRHLSEIHESMERIGQERFDPEFDPYKPRIDTPT